MVKISELTIGQHIYMVHGSLGIIRKYEFVAGDTFLDEEGTTVTLDNSKLAMCTESWDTAAIEYYKYNRQKILNDISNIKHKLNEKEVSLASLNAEFAYLKDQYPEEFI